ncbi:MAG TPA: hypothetical protein VK641_10510 [Terriglobales bacterium]|jgi:hypothetical protein|nr:hypothetical protein [Terriglobales bacterium]
MAYELDRSDSGVRTENIAHESFGQLWDARARKSGILVECVEGRLQRDLQCARMVSGNLGLECLLAQSSIGVIAPSAETPSSVEGQSEHSHDREPRVPAQLRQGVAKIMNESSHDRFLILIAEPPSTSTLAVPRAGTCLAANATAPSPATKLEIVSGARSLSPHSRTDDPLR